MSYATIQNAKDLYGEEYVLQSVDRDSNGEPDTTSLTNAFAQASSEMDTYLGVRYSVPLSSPVPEIVKQFCVDIAIYKLSSHPGGGLTEEKRKRYEDAIKWLTNLAKGVVTLPLPGTSEDPQPLPETSYDNLRVFTREKMEDIL